MGFPPWQPGRPWPSRLQRGWMRPAPGFARRPSPPFPPVTKLSRTTVTERTRLGRELNCGTSAASLSESSCLLHESRTNIIVRMDLRSLVESAHDSAGRVGMREQLYLASAPAIRRSARFFSHPPTPGIHLRTRSRYGRCRRGRRCRRCTTSGSLLRCCCTTEASLGHVLRLPDLAYRARDALR